MASYSNKFLNISDFSILGSVEPLDHALHPPLLCTHLESYSSSDHLVKKQKQKDYTCHIASKKSVAFLQSTVSGKLK